MKVGGGSNGRVSVDSLRELRRNRPIPWAVYLTVAGIRLIWRRWSRNAALMSSDREGAGSVSYESRSGTSCRSMARAIRFPDATPSASAWCTLLMTPTLPSASPSTKYITHSGLLRSSGVLAISPMASSNSRRPPGLGSRSGRTWYSRSTSTCSRHMGWWNLNGMSTNWKRIGSSLYSRWCRISRKVSMSGVPSKPLTSMMPALIVCMCTLGVSL